MQSCFTITFICPTPIVLHPPRRPRPKHYVYASSSRDERFFLPAEHRPDSRAKKHSSSLPSISAQRARQTRRERISALDDEEAVRAQISGEKLSTADLIGGDIPSPLDSTTISSSSPEASTLDGNDSLRTMDIFRDSFTASNTDKNHKSSKKVKSKTKESADLAPLSHVDTMQSNDEQEHVKPRKGVVSKQSPSAKHFITIGDLVNHKRHGIGRFLGLERTRQAGANSGPILQEYAVLEYRDGDVFVPLSHFDLIRRLTDDEARSVSRLDVISNSAAFSGYGISARSRRSKYLARRRTREKIRRQLVNLHEMYAERITCERDPFPIDEKAEQRFFRFCRFELTSDQEEATKQILSDMSGRRRPMDRLLCGDVGFGKTEVAIRATFRAIRAGRKVVILAPTTILAQQHYQTFRERLQSFDSNISVACFNRFVKKKLVDQQREMLFNSQIDVAIGTHMLLSERMAFPGLGLLIVDEEHRFGVNQKEKIRARYQQVDTLFLSATPIPRTLHLSLSGLRDASVLRTPPFGRKPVMTKAAQIGSGIVRNAISSELQRGGQVFYVVPRIEGIEATAGWIRDLFENDNVRVVVAHGASLDLEQRIWAFAQHKHDVLLCTSVIENGLDMPNVNTIIIQDAARFGLAQLHQLRGRVGRGDVQAYAYVLYTNDFGYSLSSDQRLKTFEENSQLGAGFAIAQRDMEMRGIGTVLGVEQHGNNAVGAEEYARMLAEELEHVRTGNPIPVRLPVTNSVEVLLPVASYIPDEYISNFEEKMAFYKKMSDCKSEDELDQCALEMEHGYGSLPAETRKHITLIHVKLLAKDLGIRRIMTERQHVILEWAIEEVAFKRLVVFLTEERSRARCEAVEAEERVIIRGLGVVSGDIQIAKLYEFLKCFSKAAIGLSREEEKDISLGDALAVLQGDGPTKS